MSTLRQSMNISGGILRALAPTPTSIAPGVAGFFQVQQVHSVTGTSGGAQAGIQAGKQAGIQAYQHQTHRSVVSVDVHGNKVDRALRQLRRKLIDEGVRETWMKQRVFVKPSHVRKRMLEEAERRVRGEGFKEKMRWILRRKARGY